MPVLAFFWPFLTLQKFEIINNFSPYALNGVWQQKIILGAQIGASAKIASKRLSCA
ncbi:hypothetical protein [Erythrobacter sp. T5W1-R]|uniref:hypothetical protein n=1 Tax=Erythrobacter sp. T5W1-R TaxID=3101752 RepID=UPI002B00136B|nr:hypothetical protein [Erythrobacter sp. T5W1-R]